MFLDFTLLYLFILMSKDMLISLVSMKLSLLNPFEFLLYFLKGCFQLL